ncbi:hypothetical protein BJ982_003936 [Sphaerisporangium siamense]|uniref:Uncharacterized protein n=1 Tax=Sphaerisporangium siamense TaxID=795645 RepID=A0A7W7D8V8_9ACTN|nr:hypothetical protein [Sphaerisporangium siamense]
MRAALRDDTPPPDPVKTPTPNAITPDASTRPGGDP